MAVFQYAKRVSGSRGFQSVFNIDKRKAVSHPLKHARHHIGQSTCSQLPSMCHNPLIQKNVDISTRSYHTATQPQSVTNPLQTRTEHELVRKSVNDIGLDLDSCGFAYVSGPKASNDIVQLGIEKAADLKSRGAVGFIPDGVGLTLSGGIADSVSTFSEFKPFKDQILAGSYAIANVRLKSDEHSAIHELNLILKEYGFKIDATRKVPVILPIDHPEQKEPLYQLLITGDDISRNSDLILRLFTVGQQSGKVEINSIGQQLFYGALVPEDKLSETFPDLATATAKKAYIHTRFSTNSFPTPGNIMPFGHIYLNGENLAATAMARWLENSLHKENSHLNLGGMSDTRVEDILIKYLKTKGYSLEESTELLFAKKGSALQKLIDVFAPLRHQGPAAYVIYDPSEHKVFSSTQGERPSEMTESDGIVQVGSELYTSDPIKTIGQDVITLDGDLFESQLELKASQIMNSISRIVPGSKLLISKLDKADAKKVLSDELKGRLEQYVAGEKVVVSMGNHIMGNLPFNPNERACISFPQLTARTAPNKNDVSLDQVIGVKVGIENIFSDQGWNNAKILSSPVILDQETYDSVRQFKCLDISIAKPFGEIDLKQRSTDIVDGIVKKCSVGEPDIIWVKDFEDGIVKSSLDPYIFFGKLNKELNQLDHVPKIAFETKSPLFNDPLKFAELMGLNINIIVPSLLAAYCKGENQEEKLKNMQQMCDFEIRNIARGPGIEAIGSFCNGGFTKLIKTNSDIAAYAGLQATDAGASEEDISQMNDTALKMVSKAFYQIIPTAAERTQKYQVYSPQSMKALRGEEFSKYVMKTSAKGPYATLLNKKVEIPKYRIAVVGSGVSAIESVNNIFETIKQLEPAHLNALQVVFFTKDDLFGGAASHAMGATHASRLQGSSNTLSDLVEQYPDNLSLVQQSLKHEDFEALVNNYDTVIDATGAPARKGQFEGAEYCLEPRDVLDPFRGFNTDKLTKIAHLQKSGNSILIVGVGGQALDVAAFHSRSGASFEEAPVDSKVEATRPRGTTYMLSRRDGTSIPDTDRHEISEEADGISYHQVGFTKELTELPQLLSINSNPGTDPDCTAVFVANSSIKKVEQMPNKKFKATIETPHGIEMMIVDLVYVAAGQEPKAVIPGTHPVGWRAGDIGNIAVVTEKAIQLGEKLGAEINEKIKTGQFKYSKPPEVQNSDPGQLNIQESALQANIAGEPFDQKGGAYALSLRHELAQSQPKNSLNAEVLKTYTQHMPKVPGDRVLIIPDHEKPFYVSTLVNKSHSGLETILVPAGTSLMKAIVPMDRSYQGTCNGLGTCKECVVYSESVDVVEKKLGKCANLSCQMSVDDMSGQTWAVGQAIPNWVKSFGAEVPIKNRGLVK